MRSGPNFDSVVVGEDSTRCVVAAQLIEADGKHRLLLTFLPTPFAYPPSDSRLLWSYATGREPGLDGHTSQQVRGRPVGGSSSVNGTVFASRNRCDSGIGSCSRKFGVSPVVPTNVVSKAMMRATWLFRWAGVNAILFELKARNALSSLYPTAPEQRHPRNSSRLLDTLR